MYNRHSRDGEGCTLYTMSMVWSKEVKSSSRSIGAGLVCSGARRSSWEDIHHKLNHRRHHIVHQYNE